MYSIGKEMMEYAKFCTGERKSPQKISVAEGQTALANLSYDAARTDFADALRLSAYGGSDHVL